MTAPVTTVEFGFGSTWKTADGSISWTDVSAYVRNEQRISVSRGRQSERDDFAAGTCSFTLNNADRRFDPQNAAGAYYGQLVPGVPVRIRSVANAVTSNVFRGFVHGWPQRYFLGNTLGVVPVTASDGFRRLARADLPSSVYQHEIAQDAPVLWWRLNEGTGSTAHDSSGGGFDGAYNVDSPSASTAGVLPFDPDKAIKNKKRNDSIGFGGVAFTTPPVHLTDTLPVTAVPVTVELWIRPTIDNRDMTTFARYDLFRYNVAGIFFVEVIATADANSPLLYFYMQVGTTAGGAFTDVISAAAYAYEMSHHVVARFDGTTPRLFIDGVEVTGTFSASYSPYAKSYFAVASQAPDHTLYPVDGDIDEVAVYGALLSPTQIAAHYAAGATPWNGDTADSRITRILDYIGWPASLRALSAGDTTLGSTGLGGKALPFLKAIESSEQGKLFIGKDGKVTFLNRYWTLYNAKGTTVQVTLSDDGADTAYSDMGFDYDDELIFNSATGSRQGGASITVTNQTSADAYGFSADSALDNLQLSSDYWVRSMLEYRVDRYKDPKQRLPTIKIPLHGLTAAKQSALLELEIAYRINAERTPQQVGSAIDVDETIEGISHDIGLYEHWMTFNLSTVDTRKYALWGTSLWDDADARWGF